MNQGRIIVLTGLSGGADSVCLFLLLNKLSEKLKFRVHAIHVNHNIRGESARRDEDFSRALCEKYNIPFKAYSIDVLKKAKDLKLSVEEAGRIARYECFNDYANILSENVALMDTLKGRADIKIAVAHHMNDQAETIIFNMLRGSGLKGVSGMKPVNGLYTDPDAACPANKATACFFNNYVFPYILKNSKRMMTISSLEGQSHWLKNLINLEFMRKNLMRAIADTRKELERNPQEMQRQNRPLSKFEYQDKASGQRFYDAPSQQNGALVQYRIPADAPPRPSALAIWNKFSHSWMTLKT